MDMPRYARMEIERRWLVDPARLPDISERPYRLLEDLYLPGRLRLRRITHSGAGRREFKLGKKYDRTDPMGGPIATLYLTEAEYGQFADLPGHRLSKRRWVIDGVTVDRFEGPLDGLMLCEVEVETRAAALALPTPPWAQREVTEDPFFSGGELCRLTAEELRARL
jgi:hypothetical protein